MPIEVVDAIARVMEQREDRCSVSVVLPRPRVAVLYVGPLVPDQVLKIKAEKWKGDLETEYPIVVDLHIADPPRQKTSIAEVIGLSQMPVNRRKE